MTVKIFPHLKTPIRYALRAADTLRATASSLRCHGLYDGRNLPLHRAKHGPVPVLLVVPPMSDREGALIHPGIQILQSVLRARGIACEVFNYGLPTAHSSRPYEHLEAAVTTLDTRVVGVSLYSQAIERTMEGLKRIKAAHPDLTIVLGGPHPTEAWASLVGLRFIDYVVRGEAEKSFPAVVEHVLRSEPGVRATIPGVYFYDRGQKRVVGTPAEFVNVRELDEAGVQRYRFTEEERRQYRAYGGSHGLVGPRYWPLSMVRGCPYACTYCAAYQMSGRQLRFRAAARVVDDMEHYAERYGQRHFSFVDDSFTEFYEYVVELCEEILRRKLAVCWTTDNGIRYESLGSAKRLDRFLGQGRIGSVPELLKLMIRAGWRGTSIGLESGAPRVREHLVRKGGARLTNDEIVHNLLQLKKAASAEGVYFYINAYVMLGFPDLVLRNGRVISRETDEERQETVGLVMRLREADAIDFVHPSVVIPLPATEMWDHLTISEKMEILLSRVPADHPYRGVLEGITAAVDETLRSHPTAGRYDEAAEAVFWREIYELPDDVQMLIQASYDAFNADASYKIVLRREDGDVLWAERQRLMEEFYGGVAREYQLLRHVLAMCTNIREVAGYLTCLGRIYLPATKERISL